MSKVVPRSSRIARPYYLPTAVEERINRPVLPSDTLTEWERRKMEAKGISRDQLDSLRDDVVLVRMHLPEQPVPETPIKVYKP